MDFLALLAANGEHKFLSGLQIERGRQIARANGRALGVHQNPHGHLALLRGGADILHHAAHPVMLRVRHVQPHDVHAGVDQLADHFR